MDVADTLNERVAAVLSAQETEFMHAYRGHTYAIQAEIHALRVQATGAAATQARDERVRVLEAERDWLRDESLRLSELASHREGELVELRARFAKAHSESAWLGERAKDAVRAEGRLAAIAAAGVSPRASSSGGSGGGSGGFGAATLLALSPARRAALTAAAHARAGGSGAADSALGELRCQVEALLEERDALRGEVAALRGSGGGARGGARRGSVVAAVGDGSGAPTGDGGRASADYASGAPVRDAGGFQAAAVAAAVAAAAAAAAPTLPHGHVLSPEKRRAAAGPPSTSAALAADVVQPPAPELIGLRASRLHQ